MKDFFEYRIGTTNYRDWRTYLVLLIPFLILALSSCGLRSKTEAQKAQELIIGQSPPPDLTFIPGNHKNLPSFYMGTTEEPNINWLIYLDWTKNVYISYPELYDKSLPLAYEPDELFNFNDPFIRYSYTNPAFAYYPITGVSWQQVQDYLEWKTDRMNEWILIETGLFSNNPDQVNKHNFNMTAYLVGQYEGRVRKELPDYNPYGEGQRKVDLTDGILLPGFRLPTEEEWMWASQEQFRRPLNPDAYAHPMALANAEHPYGEDYYPLLFGRYRGFVQNFYHLENHLSPAPAPAPIVNNIPQRLTSIADYRRDVYGLSGMDGNVREWVMDKWQEQPDTGRYYWEVWKESGYPPIGEKGWRDQDGYIVEKDSLGKIALIWGFNIGLLQSNTILSKFSDSSPHLVAPYDYLPLHTERHLPKLATQRVVRGGTWKEATANLRQPMYDDSASVRVGFRCAMNYSGMPVREGYKVNWMKPKRAKWKK